MALTTFGSRLLLLGLLLFIPMLAFFVFDAADRRSSAKAEAVRSVSALIDTVHVEYMSILGQGQSLGALLSQLGRIREGRTADCNKLLAAIQPLYTSFPQIAVTDREGWIVCSAVAVAARTSAADRKYFKDALARREFVVSEPLMGRVSKRSVVVLATPYLQEDGTVGGVIIVSLDLGWMSEALARFRFPPGSSVGIANGDGVVVARYPNAENSLDRSVRDAPFFREIVQRGASGAFGELGLDGVEHIFAFVRHEMHGSDSVIWAAVPAEHVYGPIHSAFVGRISLLVVGMLAILSVAWLLGRRVFLDPLGALLRAAERLGKGELAARSGVENAAGEMGQLARGFDHMAEGVRRREEALRLSEERFRLLAERSRDGMWLMTPAPEHIVYVSPAVERIWGRAAWEFYREPRLWADAIHEDERAHVIEIWEDWLAGRKREFAIEYRVLRPDGALRWVYDNAEAVRDDSGSIRYLVGIARDLTERKAYEDRIRHFATHDELTGLPNRILLVDLVEQALPAARRVDRHAAVLALNLDRLKHVNESLGHDVGDAVLVAVVAKLQNQLRPGDTIARLGGDDFAVLLPDMQRGEDAAGVARKLLDALAAPLDVKGHVLTISASLGIAIYPDDGENAAALLKNSDSALHRAKKEGGGSLRFFTNKLAVRARERLELEQALGRALELKQLSLHYQPQIDCQTGRLIGAEALVRWEHPWIGPVAPARFIPVAEETGMIVPIGEWVLREACAQAVSWRDEGLTPMRIGVNLSVRQFWHGKLEPLVRAVLRETGHPAGLVELEVTEGVVMRDAEETIATLEALKRLGLKISVDDFGTGYSSLAYLRRFPVDGLKIDGSFVKDMADEPGAAILVQSIVGLAHGLGLRVVAEGVETVEQARLLKLFRCHELQGYYISKPLASEAFRLLLKANRTWQLNGSANG